MLAIVFAGAANASLPAQETSNGATIDSIVAAAERSIDQGRPWQATRALDRLVRSATGRSPALLLVAARAAASWEGWGQVVALLSGATWLDSADAGLGHALLARAHVERGELAPAVRHARRAVELATPDRRGERLAVLARALDRAERHDSAAALYLEAARVLPDIRQWLVLRAAGLLADSARRAELYPRVEDPVARARIPWTEALALERRGDRLAAARRYEAVGARLAAIRLRLEAGDSATRRRARADLGNLLVPGLDADDAAQAIALFDRQFPSRTATEELRIARRAAAINQLERAALGYARAGAARLSDRDRFTYATVLSRLGRYADALPLYAAVQTAELQGEAAYLRARAVLRSGQVATARRDLTLVAERFAKDSTPAATALYLVGDLLAGAGHDDSARAVFRRAWGQYPTTSFGRRAGFQAALIGYLAGDLASSAAEFDSLSNASEGDEWLAALYWAGRARDRGGDSAAARRRWREVVARGPDSYYAVLAGRRLGITPLILSPAPVTWSSEERDLPAALHRARVLNRLGMRVEAGFELEGFVATANSRDRLVETAWDLARGGYHHRALRLAQRARGRGAADPDLLTLLYPLPFRDRLTAAATARGLDPFLVAGLIRQESAFDAEARSVADARGLMQILPSVGAGYARRFGVADWDPLLLYQPDLNLDFGVTHLTELVERFGVTDRAAAAYNAGADRVARWLGLRGTADDPEVFVERIPFAETRDYVRRVRANREVYRALYAPGPS